MEVFPAPPVPPETAAAPSPQGNGPSRKALLAVSAPWLGALLNVVPGLGAGYLYQRRWIAWWLTTALAGGWLLLGPPLGVAFGTVVEGGSGDPGPGLVGLGGLSLLALGSAAEAFLAARRARME
jgi:hypothetical protein